MKKLTSKSWIILKGILFLLLVLQSAMLLLLERPTLKVLALLVIAIWSACRFYYFAFYVVEHYVDPDYRFDGLLSLVGHFFRKQNRHRDTESQKR